LVRTTVTLDDDLAIRLERLSPEQGRSFKSLINEAIRAGLEVLQGLPTQRASAQGRENPVTYTLGYDLGQPLSGQVLPSGALAALEEEEDIARLGRPDAAD
jgi:hypothetical protein